MKERWFDMKGIRGRINLMAPEDLLNSFFYKKNRNIWKIFLFTFFEGIFLYFKMITLWLANPDGVWVGLIEKKEFGWENQLGRVGLQAVGKFKGGYVFPAFQTILCIFMIAMIAIFICDIFEIDSMLWGVMIGTLLICSQSLCNTLTYYFTADAYIFAFLCSVIFVFLLKKNRNMFAWVLAAMLLALSLSLYQAYVGAAISLCVLYLLFLLICKLLPWKEVIIKGGYFASAGITGGVIYLFFYKIYCNFTGITPVSDRGFDQMGKIPVKDIGKLVIKAYKGFYDYLITDNLYYNSWHFRGKINLFLMMLLIVLLISTIIYQKIYRDIKKLVLIITIIMLLPLAFMSIVILAPEVSIYGVTGTLMLPHMNFIFIFVIALAAFYKGKICYKNIFQWAAIGGCGAAIYVLVLYTQIFQNCMELELHTTYALANRIVTRLETMPDYQADMKIMIGGRAENGNYPRNYPEMYDIMKGTAIPYGYIWPDNNGQQSCWRQFFKQYLGLNYKFCSGGEAGEILATPEYQNMASFPSEGSVQMIGNYVVVKLSD